jgi:hypothetical protein
VFEEWESEEEKKSGRAGERESEGVGERGNGRRREEGIGK